MASSVGFFRTPRTRKASRLMNSRTVCSGRRQKAQQSVHPALRVRASGPRLDHPVRHRGQVPLMDGAAAGRVRMLSVACKAVLTPLAVDDLCVGWRRGALEELLHLVHGIVQISVVHRAARDMNLSSEL